MDKEYFLKKFNKIGVIGAARSGISLCKLLNRLGKKTKISDLIVPSDESLRVLNSLGAEPEFGKNTSSFFDDCDMVILSPGVPLLSEVVRELRSKGKYLTGELEFSSWFCQADIVAITGTNGKTTTTYVTSEILKRTGKKVYLLGNIGIPFSEQVLDISKDSIVCLEVSSFQLETIEDFSPKVACFLNIADDHLNRHKDFNEYFEIKKRIFLNQKANDFSLFSKADEEYFRYLNTKTLAVQVDGYKNINFAFAAQVGKIFGVSDKDISDVLDNFTGLSHRLEKITSINNIVFINDSKATNIASTLWALNLINEPIFLIAGGLDKNLDFSAINVYSHKIKRMVLIGQARDKIKQAFNCKDKCVFAKDLKEAVRYSFSNAASGDCVLLSPMCASFDMFKDYKERGDLFKQYVLALSAENS